MKYLTNSGLSYFLNKIKAYIASQLNSKASAIHTHTYSEIVDLPNGITVDSTLDGTSSNAIANSAVVDALDGKINKNDIYNLIYPVGSIYLSVNSVDPSTIFGGTWEKIKDKFLLSSGDTYSIGSTGGEASHTLTVNEMPTHNHSASTDTQGDHTHGAWTDYQGDHTHGAWTDTQGNHYHDLRGRAWGWGDTNADVSAQVGVQGGYWGGNALSSLPDRGSTVWSGSHSHGVGMNSAGSHAHNVGMNSAGGHAHTVTVNNNGAGAAHNNMPPYLTVNVWKRIA